MKYFGVIIFVLSCSIAGLGSNENFERISVNPEARSISENLAEKALAAHGERNTKTSKRWSSAETLI